MLAWLETVSTSSLAVALLAVLLGAYVSTPSAQERAVRHLPTPPGGRLRVTLSIMMRHGPRIYDWLLEQCRRYDGKPWRMQLLGRPVTVIVSTPADVEHVLKSEFESFEKGYYTSSVLHDVLGCGIFAVDGALWAHQRKTASHLFSLQMMRDIMEDAVRSHCAQLVEKLEGLESVEIKRLLDLFTMDVFTKIGFGVGVGGLKQNGAEEQQPFLDAFERSSLALLFRFQQPLWLWRVKRFIGLGAIERQLKRDMDVINETIHRIIRQSMEEQQYGTAQRRNLIGLFLDKAEALEGMNDDEKAILIRDMAVNFIAAGRDTTSQSMTWFLVMMNRNPDVLGRVVEELDAKLSSELVIPTMEDVQQLVFLEAAIKESMRLNPVVAITSRTANRDTTLPDGTFLKAGTRVAYSSYVMARLPSVWGEDAEEFKPDRWIDPATGKLTQVSPFQYPVFLGGPRLCLGMKFAMMEMKITLAVLLKKFELRTKQDPFAFTYRAAVTMGVRGPVHLQVRTRGRPVVSSD